MKPYNVLDVACFVINKHNELYPYKEITNLRLQKILYFIQCQFIIDTRERCFIEKIVAWPYGPVVIESYEEFKKYGKPSIPNVSSYGNFFNKVQFNEHIIKNDDRKRILKIINKLIEYSDYELVEITHKQSPWNNAIINGVNTEITQSDIEQYFIGN